MKNKFAVLLSLAVMASAGAVYADTSDQAASALLAGASSAGVVAATFAPTLASEASTGATILGQAHKLAILGGQEEAVGVLNGEQGGDLFNSARQAAEEITQIHFATDQDAALAVIELGQKIQ